MYPGEKALNGHSVNGTNIQQKLKVETAKPEPVSMAALVEEVRELFTNGQPAHPEIADAVSSVDEPQLDAITASTA